MSPRRIRDILSATGPDFWLGFAVHAFLRFMLPPGLSPEVALTWIRHVADAALMARPGRPTASA